MKLNPTVVLAILFILSVFVFLLIRSIKLNPEKLRAQLAIVQPEVERLKNMIDDSTTCAGDRENAASRLRRYEHVETRLLEQLKLARD